MAVPLKLDGKDYPVSALFAAAVIRSLGTMAFTTIMGGDGLPTLQEIRDLMALDGRRPLKGIKHRAHQEQNPETGEMVWVADPPIIETGGEYDRLQFLTHVHNVARTIHRVGAHHDPVKEWGLDGWDAVYNIDLMPGCGCIRHIVFDRHSALNHFGHNRLSHEEVRQPDGTIKVVQHYERKHHEIEPRRLCAAHGG